MVMFFLVVTVLFIILSTLLKFRHVAYAYVIGNIILFIFFAISGQAGGWFVLIYQIPALVPAFLGICIGTPIGYKLSARITKKQASDSALNLNGTPRTCSNAESEDLHVKDDILNK